MDSNEFLVYYIQRFYKKSQVTDLTGSEFIKIVLQLFSPTIFFVEQFGVKQEFHIFIDKYVNIPLLSNI